MAHLVQNRSSWLQIWVHLAASHCNHTPLGPQATTTHCNHTFAPLYTLSLASFLFCEARICLSPSSYTSFGVLIFRDHRDNCTDGGTEEAYRISVETASGCSGSKHLFVVVHFQDTALVLLLVQARSCSDFIVAPWRTTKSCPKLSALTRRGVC